MISYLQTNLQNNNNKYFLIQLLKDDAKNAYSVWLRWGRVGFKGQSNLIPFGPDLDAAKKTFCKKYAFSLSLKLKYIKSEYTSTKYQCKLISP